MRRHDADEADADMQTRMFDGSEEMTTLVVTRPLGRRELIGATALTTAGLLLGAGAVHADAGSLREAAAAILDGRRAEEGPITLDLPRIADDGNAVAVSVEVESPMTDEDHITSIHLLADGNPLPNLASFHLTPRSGLARVATRIRLAQSQTVTALAETSDGRVLRTSREVTVTVGGCSV